MAAKTVSGFATIILIVYSFIALWSFFTNFPSFYSSPEVLFEASITPEETMARLGGPYYLVLLQVARSTPDGAIVCFPLDIYNPLFTKGQAFYKYFWLQRKALPDNSKNCSYEVKEMGQFGQPNAQVEVIKK